MFWITASVNVADAFGGLRQETAKRINFGIIYFLKQFSLKFIHHTICVSISSVGTMPLDWDRRSWFPVVFGAALVVLTSGNVGLNQDKRQARSSSCFGGFDLYFVLDK